MEIANLFGQETVKKIYEDGASGTIKEVGKAATDFVKMFRLFTAPVQVLGAFQDRLSRCLEKVRGMVPENNQIEAPASIAGPIIERLKYLEESSPLTELYLNLLAKTIDKEKVNQAHPAFYHIIDQLSTDEAMIIYQLRNGELKYHYSKDYIDDKNSLTFSNRITRFTEFNLEQISFENHFFMYIDHLKNLTLLYSVIENEEISKDENNRPKSIYTKSNIELSRFGKLFLQACVPINGFNHKM